MIRPCSIRMDFLFRIAAAAFPASIKSEKGRGHRISRQLSFAIAAVASVFLDSPAFFANILLYEAKGGICCG